MTQLARHPVLHCVADWGLPSERFVVDLVRTTSRTQPAVVCGRKAPDFAMAGEPPIAVTELMPTVGRLPYRLRRPAIRGLMRRVAVHHHAQLLHAHFGYWAGHAAAVAARLKKPWVVSLHGFDLLVKDVDERDRELVHGASAVIVPSQFLANAASERGFPSERIHVVPSGIDVDEFTFRPRRARDDGTTRVSFAGRFVEKKGVLDALEAMAAAGQQVPLVCRFVGYGPLETDLRTAADRLGVDIDVIDGSERGALRRVLDDTDIVLTPSKTAANGDAESLGLVNIEAQACGIPVLTTRHGGIPEAVSSDGAVLVPEGDIHALTDALVTLARSPERWAAMGAAGSEHVRRRFRLADRVRDVEDLYLTLLDS